MTSVSFCNFVRFLNFPSMLWCKRPKRCCPGLFFLPNSRMFSIATVVLFIKEVV